MRKIAFLTFLLLSSFLKIQAQNTFAPLGAEWWYGGDSYDYTPQIFEGITLRYFWTDHLKVTNDTTINNIPCRQLLAERKMVAYTPTDTIHIEKDTTYFVYDNTDTAFIYYPSLAIFRPLYIFNVQEHDTVRMQNPYPNFALEDTVFTYVVDSIRTPMVGTLALKTIYTHPLRLNDAAFSYINWGSASTGAYCEKLGIHAGTSNGLLPVYINAAFDGAAFMTFPYGKLRCYTDSFLTIHNDTLTCDSLWVLNDNTVSVQSIRNISSQLAVYPNPAKDQITISSEPALEDDLDINITDISSHLLFHTVMIKRTSSLKIDVSGYVPGIYIISLQNKYGQYYSKMVIR
jgi:hypothetical protein